MQENFDQEANSFVQLSVSGESEVMVPGQDFGHTEAPADNIYSKVSRFALYLGILLMPLFFLPWTTSNLEINKQMLLLVVAGVGLVSWLLSVVSSGWVGWRGNSMNWPILGVLGATIVGTVFSLSPFKSLFGANVSLNASLLTVTALTAFYLLLVNNSNNKGELLRSIFGLSIVAALLYGVLQLLGVYVFRFPFAMSKSFNSVGTLNALGFLAAVALPFFSKNLIDLKGFSKLHLDKLGVVLSLLLVVFLNWWMVWVVVIAGMVSMMVFEIMAGAKFKMFKVLMPMTVIVLGVFFILVRPNLKSLAGDLPVEVGLSSGLSMDVAQSVLKKSPVFGFGPENFSYAFDRFGTGEISNTVLAGSRFSDATSEFLNIVVNLGVLGILAWLYLIFIVAASVYKFYKKVEKSEGGSMADAGLFASLVAAITALFMYPFNITLAFTLYTLIGLSVVVFWQGQKRYYNIEERTSLSLMSSLGFIGGLILVLVGAYFGGTNYLAETKYAKALSEGDNQKAAELVVAAVNLNSNDDRFYRTASQIALNLLASEVNSKSPLTEDRAARIRNYMTTAISLARRATEIAPGEAQNWNQLGTVYQNLLTLVDGADKLSEEAFLRAAELRPGDASYHNRIGSLYLSKYELLRRTALTQRGANLTALAQEATAALDKSEEGFKKAIEVSGNFGLAIYNLGAVYDRQGRVGDSIRELEKVIPANSNQPGLNFELGLLYYRNGQKDKAFDQLQRAVLLSPDYSNARWYLALLFEERKDVDSAILQLERILAVDSNRDNEIVTKKLEELRVGKLASPPGNVLNREPIQ